MSNPFINIIFRQPRAILAVFFIAILAGVFAYINMPREADPDIDVPVFQIVIPAPGISARDGERLVGRPIETALRGLEGIKNVFVSAGDDLIVVIAEFSITADPDQSISNIRAKVQETKADLPEVVKEPRIYETNFSLFPVLVVAISGDMPERTLLAHARVLENRLETLPAILSADIAGERDEVIDVILDPKALSAYQLSLGDVINRARANNQLITAGRNVRESGAFSVKVEGLFSDAQQVLETPLKTVDNKTITLGDVAEVRRTFKEAEGFTRLNGKRALALNIVKRRGENVLTTIEDVKAIVAEVSAEWPDVIKVDTLLDRSTEIVEIISSLENSVMTAILLVMIVSFIGLGWRPSILVGVSIPASFAMAYVVLSMLGYTLNVMVLFGMMLTVGMLVDNVIVITEYADRKMLEGQQPKSAYANAASRMVWPVLSSTLTTLAAFLPMLLWPGVSGKFMELIPIMVIIVLTCSYLSAMLATPLIGTFLGKRKKQVVGADMLMAMEDGRPFNDRDLPLMQKIFMRFNRRLFLQPLFPVLGVLGLVAGITVMFSFNPTGVEFFVNTEANKVQVYVSARGNLSETQKVGLVEQVEKRLRTIPGVTLTLIRTGAFNTASVVEAPGPVDTVGTISLELAPFSEREPIEVMLSMIEDAANMVPGTRSVARKEEQGPPQGMDIQLEVASTRYNDIALAVDAVRDIFSREAIGLQEIDDNQSLPGIAWDVVIDREAAGALNLTVLEIGNLIQLVTKGMTVGTAYPEDSLEEIDINVRLPEDQRSLQTLLDYNITTQDGPVPLSHVVSLKATEAVSRVRRTNGRFSALVRGNIPVMPQGVDENGDVIMGKADKISVQDDIDAALSEITLPPGVVIRYRGADEEEKNSGAFVQRAALFSLALMFIILLAQFRSFGQALLTLSTVIFSISGVLLGMLITGQKFSIIMTGIGVVGLAGIIVNNAIVLIDTYNDLRVKGVDARDAALRASALRLRPIFLTTFTTIIGLIPLATQTNINFADLSFGYGGITSVWWVQLSTALIAGLMISAILTLVFIPAMLILSNQVKEISSRIMVYLVMFGPLRFLKFRRTSSFN